MLYHAYELTHAAFSPMRAAARMGQEVIRNPFNPMATTYGSRAMSAALEMFINATRRYGRPAFGIDEILVDAVATPVVEEVVWSHPFCNLLHFRREGDAVAARNDPKVLMVAPMSGHHSTLLRDTVRGLLPQHDVYITDWTDARMVPLSAGPFHLDDYIYYVQDFIRLLAPDLHVISVCQPTVPVLAAISLMATAKDPQLPKTMTMMGGPIDPRRSPTAVNDLAVEKNFSWFENTVIYAVPANYPAYGRRVYPGFLQHAGFIAMNPGRHAQSHREFYMHLVTGDDEPAEGHRRFYDEYNAVLDMPAEYYLDTIKTVFQEFSLPKGTWVVGGNLVRPQDITTVALFTVEGELDDISGAGQTQAAHDLCSGIPADMQQDFVAPGCGHYGIFSGRRWREMICPKIGEFIKQHG
jgi:poly(3-hydroxybutyrate) depolymerase